MFFFWHKKECRKKIKENVVSKGREDLVERLLFSDSSQNKKSPGKQATQIFAWQAHKKVLILRLFLKIFF